MAVFGVEIIARWYLIRQMGNFLCSKKSYLRFTECSRPTLPRSSRLRSSSNRYEVSLAETFNHFCYRTQRRKGLSPACSRSPALRNLILGRNRIFAKAPPLYSGNRLKKNGTAQRKSLKLIDKLLETILLNVLSNAKILRLFRD